MLAGRNSAAAVGSTDDGELAATSSPGVRGTIHFVFAVLFFLTSSTLRAEPRNLENLFDEYVKDLQFPDSPTTQRTHKERSAPAEPAPRNRGGWFGVWMQSATMVDDLPEQYRQSGALIARVARNSPAERARIKVGDVIVRFADKEFTTLTALKNFIGAFAPNKK